MKQILIALLYALFITACASPDSDKKDPPGNSNQLEESSNEIPTKVTSVLRTAIPPLCIAILAEFN